MSRKFSKLSVVSALVLLAAAPSAKAWAPNPAEVRALMGGAPTSEVGKAPGGAGLIHAAIDIAASPKLVWTIMNDCRMLPRLVVSTTSCRVLQSDPAQGWDVKEWITHGNMVVPEIRNVVRSDYQPYSLIRFHKAGGNLKTEEGEWRLEPLNGGAGTRVIYVNQVGIDMLAPGALVREGLKHDTAKVLVNLRRECVAAAKAAP